MTIRDKFSTLDRQQDGFTLTELLAVMAILGILAGLVSGAVGGIGNSGQRARLSGDRVTIGTAVDRFFNLSFPQSYPVVRFDDTDASLAVAGDLGVRIIDFDARLPQDPDQTFTPDFIKQIPDSAAIVSWRIDTTRGILFFAREGAQLIQPAQSRVDVDADDTDPGDTSDYTLTIKMKQNEASVTILAIEIPAGYEIGGELLEAGTEIGTLSGSFSGDNPWDEGHVVSFTGSLTATGSSNEWELTIDYPGIVNNTSGSVPDRPDKTHLVKIVQPSTDVPGKITITMDRTGESTEHNLADETWTIDLKGTITVDGVTTDIIRNPDTVGVYRWLAEEGGYVNRCVNDIRRRPSQPLAQRRFHPRIECRDRRLRSTQGPSDA